MKNFAFRLESVLRQRQREEDQRKVTLAAAQKQVEDLLRQIRSANQTVAQQNMVLRTQKLVGRLDLSFIGHEKRYVATLNAFIGQTMQQLAAAQRQVVLRRAELVQAATARQMLETMKDKQRLRFQEQVARHEQAQLDELTSRHTAYGP